MWIYYSLIIISVVMFGGGFAFQDKYREKRGSSLRISMESACIGSLAGLLVLLVFCGFDIKFTAFTLFLALLASLNEMAFIFCTFKALDYINLSLFSIFTMLGGMVLPFFQGILFYDEGFTLAKALCLIFICTALFFTWERGEKKNGTLFYIGVFIFNGMSGVLSKLFSEGEYPKTSPVQYSTWIAIITAILSGTVWIILSLRKRKDEGATFETFNYTRSKMLKAYSFGATAGALNRFGNLLLVFALAFVPSSVQYPMVTGGTMVVSTVLTTFGQRKPSKKEIISVALAFFGMCALFFVPI